MQFLTKWKLIMRNNTVKTLSVAGLLTTTLLSGQAQAAIALAVDWMGGIDVCVNCAGIVIGEKTLGREGAHRLDSFRRTIEVNLIGSFNVLRLAAERMRG